MTFVIELMRSFLGEYSAEVVGWALPSLSDELSGRTGSTEEELLLLLLLRLLLLLLQAQAQLQGET